MKKAIHSIAAIIAIIGTAYGAPAFATLDPYHPGIVVPGQCPQYGPNSSTWVNVNGHHALSLYTEGNEWAGFQVLGNVAAVEHGVLPPYGRGPLPNGYVSFSVFSANPAARFQVWQFAPDGNYSMKGIFFEPVNGVVTIPIVPPNPGDGVYSAEVEVYLAPQGDVPGRAVVGNFQINGVALPGSPLVDNRAQYPADFCSGYVP